MSAPASLGKNHDFRLFLIGQFVSHVGYAFLLIALPVLVLDTTGSIGRMGLTTACMGVGRFIGGLLAGPVVDRVDRRWCMIACDLGCVLVNALVPLLWLLHAPGFWVLLVVAFAGSLLGMVFFVAQTAFIPSLVDRTQLTASNGRFMAVSGVAYLVGPVLSGLLCSTVGAAAAVGVNAVTFVVSALTLAMIRIPPRRTDGERRHPAAHAGRDALAGVRFVWREPTLRALLVLTVGADLLYIAALDLFIFYVKVTLAQGDRMVGVVFTVAAGGAILGGVFAAGVRQRLGFGVSALAALVLQAVCVLTISETRAIALVAAAACGYAFGSSAWQVYTHSIRQELTPEALLGRVAAVFTVPVSGIAPLGAAGALLLAGRIGVTEVLALMVTVYAAIVAFGALTPVRQRAPVPRHPESRSP